MEWDYLFGEYCYFFSKKQFLLNIRMSQQIPEKKQYFQRLKDKFNEKKHRLEQIISQQIQSKKAAVDQLYLKFAPIRNLPSFYSEPSNTEKNSSYFFLQQQQLPQTSETQQFICWVRNQIDHRNRVLIKNSGKKNCLLLDSQQHNIPHIYFSQANMGQIIKYQLEKMKQIYQQCQLKIQENTNHLMWIDKALRNVLKQKEIIGEIEKYVNIFQGIQQIQQQIYLVMANINKSQIMNRLFINIVNKIKKKQELTMKIKLVKGLKKKYLPVFTEIKMNNGSLNNAAKVLISLAKMKSKKNQSSLVSKINLFSQSFFRINVNIILKQISIFTVENFFFRCKEIELINILECFYVLTKKFKMKELVEQFLEKYFYSVLYIMKKQMPINIKHTFNPVDLYTLKKKLNSIFRQKTPLNKEIIFNQLIQTYQHNLTEFKKAIQFINIYIQMLEQKPTNKKITKFVGMQNKFATYLKTLMAELAQVQKSILKKKEDVLQFLQKVIEKQRQQEKQSIFSKETVRRDCVDNPWFVKQQND